MDGKAVPFLQGEERGATAAETAVRDCEGELRREKPRMRGCVSLRGRALRMRSVASGRREAAWAERRNSLWSLLLGLSAPQAWVRGIKVAFRR